MTPDLANSDPAALTVAAVIAWVAYFIVLAVQRRVASRKGEGR